MTFRRPSNKANGNTSDRRGRMVTCKHATSSVVRIEADGSITLLATDYHDKELNSPNDVVNKRDGGIYFTVQIFGRMPYPRAIVEWRRTAPTSNSSLTGSLSRTGFAFQEMRAAPHQRYGTR